MKKSYSKSIILLAFTCLSLLAKADNLKQSYFKLSTSNGLIISVYNSKANHIDYAYPHIFARIDSGKYVHPFVGNITLKGTKEQPASASYLKNSHIIKTSYKSGYDVYYFASFTRQDKVFYAVIRGTKAQLDKLSFDAETGEGKIVSGLERIENPMEDLPCRIHGNTLNAIFSRPYKGNVWEKYVLYSFTDSLHTNSDILNQTVRDLKANKQSLLDVELTYMRNCIAKAHYPKGITLAERNVIEQSVSLFKMSQVSDKEIYPYSHGQIMASLRPGLWHLAWVRDGSYAIEAMTRLGMYEEARKGLEFMLKAPSNRFKHYIYRDGEDYGPGVDYQISLTSYHGNGHEDCDFNEFGPNIEFDNYGLFLTAYCDYIQHSGDEQFFRKWHDTISHLVGDVILHIRSGNGMVKADSGPWEHHLEMVKQYTFTSGVNARGLELFANLQKQYGFSSEKFEKGAKELKEAIVRNTLIENRYFKGNSNDTQTTEKEYWDGGTFEIFANGLFPDKHLFESHLEAYSPILRIKGARDGYIRLESADPYENQEWVFVDLRIAQAHALLGNKARSYPIISYMTRQATLNNNQLPEMISNEEQMKKVTPNYYQSDLWCNCVRQTDGQFIGMIPMIGYGSAAYILALCSYYEH